ncbi:hypothetical protein K2173_007263 [Erythroxylum novogranatense]|uniref:EF-hand domain-containing protein n=1 Tax=Erythroxylum novogranatense TaxID=1862640 RepID=A0AAV8T7F1_9ROSI|nr:hypothetical protein K2173_007263 [Erythroxylum novogranatense]
MATSSPRFSKVSKWFASGRLKSSLSRRHAKTKLLSAPSSPSITPRRSRNQEELLNVFNHFDTDGDGKISSEELGAYFASIGERMPSDEVQKIINDFDVNGDSLLEFSEFLKLVGGDKEVEEDDLKRAFEIYEAQDVDGCITPRGLQKMLNRFGDPKSMEECENMIRAFDLDGNGVLDFHEFQQMMS